MADKKCKPYFWHMKPEFILRGYDFNVSAVTDAGCENAEIRWSTDGGERQASAMASTVSSKCDNACVMSAVVPAAAFDTSNTVRYSIIIDGNESETYDVPVCSAGKLPALVITEFFARPKGLGVTAFIEVMNPGSEPVDLFDYKLEVFLGKNLAVKPRVSFNLADERGVSIIAPRSVALIWPLMPKNHTLDNGKYLTAEGFCEACMSDFPRPEYDLVPDELNLIPVEVSRFDEATGTYVLRDGMNEFPCKTELVTLMILPRDGGTDDAVYSIVYNEGPDYSRDTPVKYSSVWGFDIRKPSQGEVLLHRAIITPGKLSAFQTVPELSVQYPAVMPLDVAKTVNASDGELNIRFAPEVGHIAGAYAELRCSDGKYIRCNATENENGIYSVAFPSYETDKLKKLEYTITVFDGVRKATVGTLSQPLITKIKDNKGPRIISSMPTEGFAFDNDRQPTIEVKFFDVAEVNLSESIICVDKKNVSRDARWDAGSVKFIPDKPMRYGEHDFEIMLKDTLGNKTYRRIAFTVCRDSEQKLYHGEVHAHTADSDGTAGLAEAMEHARNAGGVDFFSVTDHSHYMDRALYEQQLRDVEKYNDPGKFAALFGWEMTWCSTCGLWGHMNILNSEWIFNDIKVYGIPEIYERLKKDRGAVAMFNHPGLAWGNFLDFSNWSEDADRAVCLSEIKGAGYDKEYASLLARGWHAAPAFNEDNHGYNWTTATKSTTYVLAPALTRENILEAFRRRRTYSTSDPTMKILFKANGEWMGTRLNNPTKLSIDVNITTESERGIGNISLVSEDNMVIASVNAGALREYHWKLSVPASFDYYYIKVTSQGQYTVTAPVWVEGRNALEIADFTYSHGDDNYKSEVMTATLVNNSQAEMRGVKADFYLTAGGIDINKDVPYASVDVPAISAGKSASISCCFPDIVNMRRASVVVSGMSGIHRYVDTAAAMLSPVRITEICAKTSALSAEDGSITNNPYSYMQICNYSNRDIVLDGYYTRLWCVTGKAPTENKTLHLDGSTIKAGKTLTLWRRPAGSGLSADDFNRHYGVMLHEGDELIISNIGFISGADETRRVELMLGNETLSRVEYNFGCSCGHDVIEDKAIVFDSRPVPTGTSKIITNSADPSPAALRTDI